MKIFDYTMAEERKISGTPYYFQKTSYGYSLCKIGFNTPFLRGISDFLTFEEDGCMYVAFRTIDEVYAVYSLHDPEHLEKIISLHPGTKRGDLPYEFCIELDLGMHSKKIFNILENLKFEVDVPKPTRTVKIKNHNHGNANIEINIGNEKRFNSITVCEGRSKVKYVC